MDGFTAYMKKHKSMFFSFLIHLRLSGISGGVSWSIWKAEK